VHSIGLISRHKGIILIVYLVMQTLPRKYPFAEINVAQQTGCDQNGEHNECSATF